MKIIVENMVNVFVEVFKLVKEFFDLLVIIKKEMKGLS